MQARTSTIAGFGDTQFDAPDTDGNGHGDNSTGFWLGASMLMHGTAQVQPDSSMAWVAQTTSVPAVYDPTKHIAVVGSALVNGAATGACMGDSGGPLIRPFYGPTQGGQALDTVIGVLSYGPVSQISLGDKTNGQQLCGDPNRPDAYTRIGPYRAWIDTTIAGSGETASNFLSPIMDLFANLGKVKDAGPEAGNTAGGMNEQGESIDGDLEMVALAATLWREHR